MTAKNKNHRMMVVSRLARYSLERDATGEFLRITGPFGIPKLFMPPARWSQLNTSYRRELNAWKQGESVVMIALIEAERKPFTATVLDVALMTVSRRWIPYESSYEAKIEQLMYEQQRSFYKPLRYDADESCVFPDFWLMDGRVSDIPMEVFGMSTPEYLTRKNKKLEYYDREFGENFWKWDAASNEPIPELPAKKDKKTVS